MLELRRRPPAHFCGSPLLPDAEKESPAALAEGYAFSSDVDHVEQYDSLPWWKRILIDHGFRARVTELASVCYRKELHVLEHTPELISSLDGSDGTHYMAQYVRLPKGVRLARRHPSSIVLASSLASQRRSALANMPPAINPHIEQQQVEDIEERLRQRRYEELRCTGHLRQGEGEGMKEARERQHMARTSPAGQAARRKARSSSLWGEGMEVAMGAGGSGDALLAMDLEERANRQLYIFSSDEEEEGNDNKPATRWTSPKPHAAPSSSREGDTRHGHIYPSVGAAITATATDSHASSAPGGKAAASPPPPRSTSDGTASPPPPPSSAAPHAATFSPMDNLYGFSYFWGGGGSLPPPGYIRVAPYPHRAMWPEDRDERRRRRREAAQRQRATRMAVIVNLRNAKVQRLRRRGYQVEYNDFSLPDIEGGRGGAGEDSSGSSSSSDEENAAAAWVAARSGRRGRGGGQGAVGKLCGSAIGDTTRSARSNGTLFTATALPQLSGAVVGIPATQRDSVLGQPWVRDGPLHINVVARITRRTRRRRGRGRGVGRREESPARAEFTEASHSKAANMAAAVLQKAIASAKAGDDDNGNDAGGEGVATTTPHEEEVEEEVDVVLGCFRQSRWLIHFKVYCRALHAEAKREATDCAGRLADVLPAPTAAAETATGTTVSPPTPSPLRGEGSAVFSPTTTGQSTPPVAAMASVSWLRDIPFFESPVLRVQQTAPQLVRPRDRGSVNWSTVQPARCWDGLFVCPPASDLSHPSHAVWQQLHRDSFLTRQALHDIFSCLHVDAELRLSKDAYVDFVLDLLHLFFPTHLRHIHLAIAEEEWAYRGCAEHVGFETFFEHFFSFPFMFLRDLAAVTERDYVEFWTLVRVCLCENANTVPTLLPYHTTAPSYYYRPRNTSSRSTSRSSSTSFASAAFACGKEGNDAALGGNGGITRAMGSAHHSKRKSCTVNTVTTNSTLSQQPWHRPRRRSHTAPPSRHASPKKAKATVVGTFTSRRASCQAEAVASTSQSGATPDEEEEDSNSRHHRREGEVGDRAMSSGGETRTDHHRRGRTTMWLQPVQQAASPSPSPSLAPRARDETAVVFSMLMESAASQENVRRIHGGRAETVGNGDVHGDSKPAPRAVKPRRATGSPFLLPPPPAAAAADAVTAPEQRGGGGRRRRLSLLVPVLGLLPNQVQQLYCTDFRHHEDYNLHVATQQILREDSAVRALPPMRQYAAALTRGRRQCEQKQNTAEAAAAAAAAGVTAAFSPTTVTEATCRKRGALATQKARRGTHAENNHTHTKKSVGEAGLRTSEGASGRTAAVSHHNGHPSSEEDWENVFTSSAAPHSGMADSVGRNVHLAEALDERRDRLRQAEEDRRLAVLLAGSLHYQSRHRRLLVAHHQAVDKCEQISSGWDKGRDTVYDPYTPTSPTAAAAAVSMTTTRPVPLQPSSSLGAGLLQASSALTTVEDDLLRYLRHVPDDVFEGPVSLRQRFLVHCGYERERSEYATRTATMMTARTALWCRGMADAARGGGQGHSTLRAGLSDPKASITPGESPHPSLTTTTTTTPPSTQGARFSKATGSAATALVKATAVPTSVRSPMLSPTGHHQSGGPLSATIGSPQQPLSASRRTTDGLGNRLTKTASSSSSPLLPLASSMAPADGGQPQHKEQRSPQPLQTTSASPNHARETTAAGRTPGVQTVVKPSNRLNASAAAAVSFAQGTYPVLPVLQLAPHSAAPPGAAKAAAVVAAAVREEPQPTECTSYHHHRSFSQSHTRQYSNASISLLPEHDDDDDGEGMLLHATLFNGATLGQKQSSRKQSLLSGSVHAKNVPAHRQGKDQQQQQQLRGGHAPLRRSLFPKPARKANRLDRPSPPPARTKAAALAAMRNGATIATTGSMSTFLYEIGAGTAMAGSSTSGGSTPVQRGEAALGGEAAAPAAAGETSPAAARLFDAAQRTHLARSERARRPGDNLVVRTSGVAAAARLATDLRGSSSLAASNVAGDERGGTSTSAEVMVRLRAKQQRDARFRALMATKPSRKHGLSM